MTTVRRSVPASLATGVALPLALAALTARTRHKGSQDAAKGDGKISIGGTPRFRTQRASARFTKASRQGSHQPSRASANSRTHARPARPCPSSRPGPPTCRRWLCKPASKGSLAPRKPGQSCAGAGPNGYGQWIPRTVFGRNARWAEDAKAGPRSGVSRGFRPPNFAGQFPRFFGVHRLPVADLTTRPKRAPTTLPPSPKH